MRTLCQKHGDARQGAGRRSSAKRGAGRTRLLFWVCACWLLLGALPASPQADDNTEYKVKLAFLYNFAQFVQWPSEAFRGADAPLTICVAGENPFRGELAQGLRGRKAGGHPIEIKRIKTGDNPNACHLIFVRAEEKRATERILASLRGSTLTVGETKGFAQRGGVINLTQENNKLSFEINVDAANQTRLKISSKLLALAKIVGGPHDR